VACSEYFYQLKAKQKQAQQEQLKPVGGIGSQKKEIFTYTFSPTETLLQLEKTACTGIMLRVAITFCLTQDLQPQET